MVATADASLGVIEPGKLYLASEARRRLKLGDKAWKQLRADGLKVVRAGRNAYVLGDDLLRAFSELEAVTA
ncbi:MAG: hypothetical protein IID44_29800 [Planctomycetes bacterium]|nr:hypothetical protein [Planctomycetota bacterium]